MIYGHSGESGDVVYTPWFPRGQLDSLRISYQVTDQNGGEVAMQVESMNVGDSSVTNGANIAATSTPGLHVAVESNPKERWRTKFTFSSGTGAPNRITVAIIGAIGV